MEMTEFTDKNLNTFITILQICSRNPHIQEVQRILHRINTKKGTPRWIIIKVLSPVIKRKS